MDYESLSTIVLVVIVAILMVSWLPRRTVQGMKQVIKHQSDRYSASLHLIDEGDGTRFSDARTVELKGTPMASPHTVRDREYVAQVRDLRRAAARRRKILVGALLGISVLVFVLAVILVFSHTSLSYLLHSCAWCSHWGRMPPDRPANGRTDTRSGSVNSRNARCVRTSVSWRSARVRHILSLRPAGRCKTVRRPTSWRHVRFTSLAARPRGAGTGDCATQGAGYS